MGVFLASRPRAPCRIRRRRGHAAREDVKPSRTWTLACWVARPDATEPSSSGIRVRSLKEALPTLMPSTCSGAGPRYFQQKPAQWPFYQRQAQWQFYQWVSYFQQKPAQWLFYQRPEVGPMAVLSRQKQPDGQTPDFSNNLQFRYYPAQSIYQRPGQAICSNR